MMKQKILVLINKLKNLEIDTNTTFQYLVFVIISFIFWAFISLNDNIQYDIEMPVEITNVPDRATIISDVPHKLTVTVKDKGVYLLRFIVGKNPELKLKFENYASGEGMFVVTNTELRKSIREAFENSTVIQALSLEEIQLKYTDLPGKKVPIKTDMDVRPNMQYTIFGPITTDCDSAIIYSDYNTLASIEEVYTYRVEERNLTDTLLRSVAIAPIEGAKIEPERVTLTIPVEPLIVKKQDAPIIVKNAPENINVITFPSKVVASFLVPFSMYKKHMPFNAIVDYRDLNRLESNKVHVKIEEAPAIYENISLEQDSVEFIIEKH